MSYRSYTPKPLPPRNPRYTKSKEGTKDVNVNTDAQVKIIQEYDKLGPHVSPGCCTGTDHSIIFHYFQILKHEETENEALKKEIHERKAKFETHSDTLNDDIAKGVYTIVNELSRKISDACYSPVGFDSLADGTKLGPQCNQFDFIIPLNPRCYTVSFCKHSNGINSIAVTFRDFVQSDSSLPLTIFDCKVSRNGNDVDLQNLRKYFGEMILKHMPQVPLPNNFKHAGFQLNYEKPTFSGYRMHGPAFMLQFYYTTCMEEILITVDLVPAFAAETNCCTIYEEGSTNYKLRDVIGDEALPATIYFVALVDSFGIFMPRVAERLLNKNDNFMHKILRQLKILTKELLFTDPEKLKIFTTGYGGGEPSQTKDVKLDILLRLQKYSVSAAERPQGIKGELYEPWTPISSYSLKSLLFRVMHPIDDVMKYDENDYLAVIRLCMLVIVYNCFKLSTECTDKLISLNYSWELNQYKSSTNILPSPSAMLITEPERLRWHSIKKDLEALRNIYERELNKKVSSFKNNAWSQCVKY